MVVSPDQLLLPLARVRTPELPPEGAPTISSVGTKYPLVFERDAQPGTEVPVVLWKIKVICWLPSPPSKLWKPARSKDISTSPALAPKLAEVPRTPVVF